MCGYNGRLFDRAHRVNVVEALSGPGRGLGERVFRGTQANFTCHDGSFHYSWCVITRALFRREL